MIILWKYLILLMAVNIDTYNMSVPGIMSSSDDTFSPRVDL